MLQLQNIIRRNILALKPYSSARSEFKGVATTFLDANENSLASGEGAYNRYPDPLQSQLKEKVAQLKSVTPSQIFIGNGSDEAIDLLIRATCNPGTDNIIMNSPGYGMYEVSAAINDVTVRKVLLTDTFQPDVPAILDQADHNTRLIFICSPNNPTGNLAAPDTILQLLQSFKGLVVVDEAYIDFTPASSWITRLADFPNLVILQTFSKAWGMAGMRLGMAFADESLINVLNKIKPPYNISQPVLDKALRLMEQEQQVAAWISAINSERERLAIALRKIPFIKTVFPSDANFLLVRVDDAEKIYSYLLQQSIVVRNRHGQPLCDHCLRITIGTPEENNLLLQALQQYQS